MDTIVEMLPLLATVAVITIARNLYEAYVLGRAESEPESRRRS